jgi:hypothetical protein
VTAAPVVLAATPLTGHVRPVLNLARHLVAAGRTVTVVGGSRFARQVETVGAAFVLCAMVCRLLSREAARTSLRWLPGLRISASVSICAPVDRSPWRWGRPSDTCSTSRRSDAVRGN